MEALFKLHRSTTGALQSDVQSMLVEVISKGIVLPGQPLPSCRKLAKQISVSRNTVILAYQKLIDSGLVVTRERSGYFVNPELELERPETASHAQERAAVTDFLAGLAERRVPPSRLDVIQRPANWHEYPYPFVYSQVDSGDFPLNEWRECTRLSQTAQGLNLWSGDREYRDSPELIMQIKTQLLPRRGILARDDEILVTLGAQNGLFLIGDLIGGSDAVIGMENPGYPDARNIFQLTRNQVRAIPLDAEGICVGPDLTGCTAVFVTPSHQFPTSVTMSAGRRADLLAAAGEKNFLIVEDDYEAEVNHMRRPMPALKSEDRDGRVIYLGSLSKSLFPGLRLGYVVGHPSLIAELRALRGAMLRHPPSMVQEAAARYIRLGYFEAANRRLRNRNKRRWELLSRLLVERLPGVRAWPANGGSAFWLQGPAGFDAGIFAERLLTRGVVIEPGAPCFDDPEKGRRHFRLGYAALPSRRIEEGIAIIAEEFDHMVSGAG